MKKILYFCILLMCGAIWAQDNSNEYSASIVQTDKTNNTSEYLLEKNVFLEITNETDTKVLTQNNVENKTFSNLDGVQNGFYVINNIYKDSKDLKKTVEKLKHKGFDAGFISDSDNYSHYVYLEYFTDLQKVVAACNSNLDGKYNKEVWVLVADNPENKTQIDTDSNIANNESKSQKSYSTVVEEKKDKLVKRADTYFNKLWYAEAAELYEIALNENKVDKNYKIIERVGDAHYFNTNMERAYYWYDILYSNYSEEMSSDNLFKYAHSLKGTGKYNRAKRLMRLYNKKVKEEDFSIERNNTSRETVLDNILDSGKTFDVKNLAMNTIYSDFSPVFHNENEVVFASAKDSSFLNTRRYKWNNQPYLDLYVAKINEESQDLRNVTKFSKKINTKYHEASATFSPDNRTMYFTRNNYGKKLKRDKNGINHLKIYKANKVDGEWTEAVEVSFNSNDYSTGHPALSPDGKLLYFVSDMPGSIGQTDIFVVDVLENGDFSKPRNLGPQINTEQKEMFPFINDKKLYFSSNGHVGLGGLDVFEAKIDEKEGFKDVKNVGQPINSKKDDFSYIVNEETQKGFFASNRKGGKGDDDIYSFKRLIVEENNENAIAGVVTELITGDVMPEALVVLLDENNIKLKEIEVEQDGSFIFEDLDSNTKYTLKTVKGEYFEDIQKVSTKDNEIVNTDIALKKLKELIVVEEGITKLKTEKIYFDFDKSLVREDASRELDKLVEVMTEYPEMVIKIESHTDAIGNQNYNKRLSDRRAKASRKYIIEKGISADRIESAIGYGEEKLLNDCVYGTPCSEEQHELNRRSEFIIVKM